MSKSTRQLKLVIKAGTITAIYDDALTALFDGADVDIRRATRVEPDGKNWIADLSPVGGPVLRGFTTRKAALAAEVRYLDRYVVA
jgi:hypothetical protein